MVEIKGFNEAYKAMLAKETVKKKDFKEAQRVITGGKSR